MPYFRDQPYPASQAAGEFSLQVHSSHLPNPLSFPHHHPSSCSPRVNLHHIEGEKLRRVSWSRRFPCFAQRRATRRRLLVPQPLGVHKSTCRRPQPDSRTTPASLHPLTYNPLQITSNIARITAINPRHPATTPPTPHPSTPQPLSPSTPQLHTPPTNPPPPHYQRTALTMSSRSSLVPSSTSSPGFVTRTPIARCVLAALLTEGGVG